MAIVPMPVVPVYANLRVVVLRVGDKLLVRHTMLGFDPDEASLHWLRWEDDPPLQR